ncbi:hypothetical protein NRB_39730 [Novosphingobium sp. 11B]
MEEQRTLGLALPGAVLGDLGDGDGFLPAGRILAHGRHRAAADERELRGLVDHAAIARREAARLGAVDDHTAHGKLAFQRFTACFEVDRAGKAAHIARHVIRRLLLRHQFLKGIRIGGVCFLGLGLGGGKRLYDRFGNELRGGLRFYQRRNEIRCGGARARGA